MIQIINQSDFLWSISTSYKGSRSVPLEISLTPLSKPKNNFIDVASGNFRKFGDGVKQEIANAIQDGIIVVNDLTDLHSAADNSMLPELSTGISAGNLDRMIQSTIAFKTTYNTHDASKIFHIPPTATHQIVHADPTDLATLLDFLGNAITGAKVVYNAHMADAGIHAAADIVNDVGYAIPVLTAQAAAAALIELWGTYKQHKRWADYNVGTSPLTPITVFTY